MRLLSVGIRPQAASIKPAGNHLRWSLPAALGFPQKGFRVWRRKSGFKPNVSKLPHVNKPKQQRIDTDDFIAIWQKNTTIQTTADGHWKITAGSGDQLLLRFDKPLVYLEVNYANPSSTNDITAYRGRQKTTSSQQAQNSGTQTLRISGSYFDHVLLSLNFEVLLGLRLVTEQEHLAAQDWKVVADIPLLQPNDQSAAAARFEEDLENRYAASRDKAIDRYVHEVDRLIAEQQQLLDDVADRELIAEPSAANDISMRPLSAKTALSLASTDPNIARLLGLYWVDRDKGANPPDDDRAHDYKIDALYRTGPVSGLAVAIGAGDAELPATPEKLAASQLPGVAWQGRIPLGQAGLYWPDNTPDWSPVQTVFIDVLRKNHRDNKTHLITEKTPLALTRAANGEATVLRFKDRLLPLGSHEYQLRGIDLFGQTGKESEPVKCEIRDLGAPPSPVRLRASVIQHGFPWTDPNARTDISPAKLKQGKVTLAFEYGDTQRLQAPDAKLVRIHWRRNSIRDRFSGKVEAVQVLETTSGISQIKLRISDLSAKKASSLLGGSVATVSEQGTALDNVNRRIGRVQSIDDTWLHVEIGASISVGDEVELTTDAANRLNWIKIESEVALREPLEAKVSEIRKPVVSILSVTQSDETDLQAANDIAASIPAAYQPPTAPPATQELIINRDLLEPNLFAMADASLVNGNDSAGVLYSTTGHGSGDASIDTAAKLALNTDAGFSSGQTLSLSGALSGDDHVGDPIRYLTMDVLLDIPHSAFAGLPAGGEMAFAFTASGESQRVIARVVSSSVDANGQTLCMTKFRLKDWQSFSANLPGAQAFYYAPYLLDAAIDVSILAPGSNFPDNEPAWEAQADKGIFLGFMALTAVDDRAQEGPLSKPVEASAIRPPPLGQPDAPRPCDVAPADIAILQKGKARPPDLHGKATVCLEWSTANITPNSGLRCEIARALDATLIETDRKNWLQNIAPPGLADNSTTGVIAGQQIAVLPVVDTPPPAVTANGLVAIITEVDTNFASADQKQLAAFVGGRLKTELLIAGQPQTHCFKITKVQLQLQPAAGDGLPGPVVGLRWLLQPMARGRTQIGDTVDVESPPDYRQTRQNDQYLAVLADKPSNQSAFGIVSGAAFEANSGQSFRFTDELPGLGANRFFYKARAVDAANNHSQWSPASVPIHQTDTRPPPAPEITKVSPLPGSVALHVRVSSGDNIAGYRLFRATREDELDTIDHLAEYLPASAGAGAGSQHVFEPVALTTSLGNIDIGAHADVPANLAIGGIAGDRLVAVHRADDTSDPKTNYLVSDKTELDGDAVVGINPLLEEGAAVVLVLADAKGRQTIIYRNSQGDAPLTQQQGRLAFNKPFEYSEILGVYQSFDYDSTETFANQSGRNLFINTSTFDAGTARITGLDVVTLTDQRPVVVIARYVKPDGTQETVTIDHRFGDLDVLRCSGNKEDGFSVDLHLPIKPVQVKGIYRQPEYDHGRTPADQSAPDYTVNRVTRIELDRGLVTGLNPLLADAQTITLTLAIAGVSRVIEHRTDTVVLMDRNVPGLSPGNRFAYGVAAVRDIPLDRGAPIRVAGAMTKLRARALSNGE